LIFIFYCDRAVCKSLPFSDIALHVASLHTYIELLLWIVGTEARTSISWVILRNVIKLFIRNQGSSAYRQDYGLDRGSIPDRVNNEFFSLRHRVQTDPGNRVLFPRGKAAGA
jgi:hypothetical protein